MNMGCTCKNAQSMVQLVSLSLYIISNCPMPIDAYCKHSTMSLIAVSEKHLKRSQHNLRNNNDMTWLRKNAHFQPKNP